MRILLIISITLLSLLMSGCNVSVESIPVQEIGGVTIEVIGNVPIYTNSNFRYNLIKMSDKNGNVSYQLIR